SLRSTGGEGERVPDCKAAGSGASAAGAGTPMSVFFGVAAAPFATLDDVAPGALLAALLGLSEPGRAEPLTGAVGPAGSGGGASQLGRNSAASRSASSGSSEPPPDAASFGLFAIRLRTRLAPGTAEAQFTLLHRWARVCPHPPVSMSCSGAQTVPFIVNPLYGRQRMS